MVVDGYSIQYEPQGTSSDVSLIHGYRVQLLQDDDVPDEMYQENHVALFFDSLIWCFGNLHHFFKDFMVDYFLMTQALNISTAARR